MNDAGARAEDLCAGLLRAAGLVLIERNWRCRLGEIDLIAEERGMLVFAEVRLRTGSGFGGAGESVTAAKRQRLIAAARLYLARRPEARSSVPCRFDVFLVDGASASVQWIRDAFGE
jgi:putative endonuclease